DSFDVRMLVKKPLRGGHCTFWGEVCGDDDRRLQAGVAGAALEAFETIAAHGHIELAGDRGEAPMPALCEMLRGTSRAVDVVRVDVEVRAVAVIEGAAAEDGGGRGVEFSE